MKVKVEQLQKHYGNKQVLKNINFCIEHNEIVSIVGPNGAGKTTLLEILMTLRSWDEGSVEVMGYNLKRESQVQALRGEMGVVIQEGGMYAYLKIKEILDLFAGLYKVPSSRVKEVITLFSLSSHLNSKYIKLSGGWKQRVLLAISFLHHPTLLFLDEPTTGLDPKATRDLWEIVHTAKKRGTTILLSTHSLEEIDMYADRVMMLNEGKIVEYDTPSTLKTKYNCTYFKDVYFGVMEGRGNQRDNVAQQAN
ncbi:ABC transporter ATP-binding protein [Longirhabdus pacifica]|uniref:ABC transporter ATP-binding protein n=1 Tax=Longirhabdus pacifica TaxID=2305227 RepID=UPI001008EC82|nr:ABC transporter ATP-binding protein [Longirhabdus pacifica]